MIDMARETAGDALPVGPASADLKPMLRRVARAALSGMTDAQIAADVGRALDIAQAAVRAAHAATIEGADA